MKKSFYAAFICLVLFVGFVFLAGCTQNNPPKTSDSNALRVGLVIPLTGPVSQLGNDFLNGFLLAKDDINNSNITFYIEDSQSTATAGVNAATKLLDTQKVDVLVSIQSAVVMPVLDVADKHHVPLIATLISVNDFTQKSPNAFRLFYPAKESAEAIADFANKKNIQSVSVLTILDEYGQAMKESFKEKFNGNILYDEGFDVGQQDYRTFLTKLPDSSTLFFVGYNQHYINLLKERQELGKKITILSNDNLVSKYLQSQVGLLLTDIYASAPSFIVSLDTNNKFTNDFSIKYGHKPDVLAPFGYDAMLVLDAIQKSDKKPLEALYDVNIRGVTGILSFDANRESHPALIIVQAKNGIVGLVE